MTTILWLLTRNFAGSANVRYVRKADLARRRGSTVDRGNEEKTGRGEKEEGEGRGEEEGGGEKEANGGGGCEEREEGG